jgi:thioesterase domain-containing protein/acyl carrier protein
MVPSALVVIDRLPLTLQGKLDRAALPPPPVRRSTTDQPIRAPRTRSEQTLVEIWEELLEVSPIGIDDDFFELGGHSMLAVRMVSAVQQQTGKTLPLAALFRAPTIERLAESLDQPDLGPTTLVPLAIGGSAAPLFCIHPAGGTVFCYRELADAFAGGRPVFGVQARGLDGAQPPHTTATEMASDYAHAIVSAHPTGPIHLVGWSLGGNIAFEVARCLRDLGRDVGLLALLDAGLISAETELTEEDFLPLIAALFPGQKAESLEAIRQKSPEQQLAYFIEQASIAGIIPEETAEVGPHIFDVFQANIKAVHEHPTESYDGPLLLIRPADQAKTGELFNDPALGWGKLVREVRVETVSGDHAHMLQQPAVAQIAAILRNALSI